MPKFGSKLIVVKNIAITLKKLLTTLKMQCNNSYA